jgi:endonuclease/exonuclease/phosphatase family metal-dependent hydrolase
MPAKARPLKLLSLNCWAGRLFPSIRDYILSENADVICLQEVLRSDTTEAQWVTYRDGHLEYQQRANLFKDMRAALPDHDAFFCTSMRGELSADTRPIWAEFGLATFVRRGLPVLGQAMDFIHGQYRHDGWGPHPRPRNAHVVRIYDPGAGQPVTIAHLHGLRGEDGKHDTPERLAQAHALVALINRIWRPNEKLIVCGDFNLMPESVTFDMFHSLGLTDLVTANAVTSTRTSYYSKPERYADYIVVSPQVDVSSFEVIREPEVSDHCPLLLEFT